MLLQRCTNPGKPRALRRARPNVFILGLFLALLLAVAAGTGLAASPSPCGPNPSAECLTQELVTLNDQYQRAARAKQARLLNDMLSVAAERQQVLVGLVESDPGEVLRVALPADQRQSLPPPVQPSVEQTVALVGALEVLHEDRDTGSRYLHFLQATGQRLALYFAAEPPTLPTGTRVRVSGVQVQVGGPLALSSGGSVQTLTAVVPNTFGAQNTLVILVNFQDNPTNQPYTPAYAQGVVFSTTSNYYLENSYQQTWLTGDVAGWFTIAQDSTAVCDYSKTATLAEQAATAAGVTLSAYSRRIYAFPDNTCTWWGLGTVGGNPSKAWVNGSFQLRVVGHELGHNYGDYHSHSLSCAAGTCTASEYGDGWDIMGASSGHFTAFQKERLGWLNYGASPPITAVTADGTYPLDPYEPDSVNPKALKLWKSTNPSTGKNTYYYVEYRTKWGADSSLASAVLVHTGSEESANYSYLWDLDPATTTADWGLNVGQSYTDANAAVTLTTLSADSTGAWVQVAFGPLPCAGANPTVALSPSGTQSIAAGAAVAYTVSVTDNDSANCGPSTFTLGATVPTVPTGWTAVFAPASLTLSPGSSDNTTTLTLTSPTTASDLYTIPVTAANGTYVGTTSASVSILAPCANFNPTVALSPTSQWVKTGTTATYTVTVTNNDTSACTASSFSLSAALPNGWTAAFASTLVPVSPGVSGSTTLAVTSSATTPDGFYSLAVTATNSAAPTYKGSASALEACLLSLAVKATTDKPSYPSPSFVTITVNVRVGQTPIAGASVTITVAKPGSSGTTLTGTTDGNGNIVVKYKVGPKTSGTYQVMAAATANGFNGSDNTATFKVQ